MADAEPGLGILLTSALRAFTDLLHAELDDRGHTGVRPAFGAVFKALREREVTSTELADELGVTKQAVGKVVAAMTAQGLVESRPSPGDGRAKPLTLTTKGRHTTADGLDAAREIERQIVARIGPRASTSLRRSLEEIVDLAGGSDQLARGTTKAVW